MKGDEETWFSDSPFLYLHYKLKEMLNGEELIGRAREVWDKIDHEGLDWKSFANGWLQGRLDLIEKTTSKEVRQ